MHIEFVDDLKDHAIGTKFTIGDGLRPQLDAYAITRHAKVLTNGKGLFMLSSLPGKPPKAPKPPKPTAMRPPGRPLSDHWKPLLNIQPGQMVSVPLSTTTEHPMQAARNKATLVSKKLRALISVTKSADGKSAEFTRKE